MRFKDHKKNAIHVKLFEGGLKSECIQSFWNFLVEINSMIEKRFSLLLKTFYCLQSQRLMSLKSPAGRGH